MAFYAIGDIHGCARTFDALYDQLAQDAGGSLGPSDVLVFVGDYIDRGPASAAVLDRMIELEPAAGTEGPVCGFLRGNHDQMMLDYAHGVGDPDLWWVNGGQTTLEAYARRGDLKLPEAHVAFLERTAVAAEGAGAAYVHAGFDTRRTVADNLDDPDPSIALWTRQHLDADLSNWEMPVVCGHTPVAEPIDRPRLIAIDTGAVFVGRPGLGRLTAVSMPDRRFVAVDTVDDIAS